ncbi:cell wall hydrolase/autolysin [Mucilaginibacter paludis DSM 18603]|uniref:N-acetylmuramoyl-L-alanine amidase n=1 Tax=Mucilaginibacter paludis DSM 18603 TaxID=714943 RepID=H1Y3D7_9SPHI|nr:cell wall hydrolase/autolysin [Mucilaginibacter paludis DSM 18603]
MKNRALRRYIYCLSPLLFLFHSGSGQIANPVKKDSTVSSGFKLRTVVVDAGHGGHTGAAGAYSTEEGVTLALAFKLQKAIEKNLPDIKVVMTRTTTANVPWQTRSDIANNNKGDLFISLHCNSLADRIVVSHGRRIRVPDKSGRGVLVLVYGFHRDKEEAAALRENLFEEKDGQGSNSGFDPNDPTAMILLNAFKAKYRKNSIRFANLVNNEFVDTDGRHSDGVKEQGILVLCHSAMPAVLIETGFINNPIDEDYLNSEDGQNEIVASIVRALTEYKKEVE